MLAAVCADQRRAGVMHRRFPLAETRDRAEHAMELLGLAGKRNRTAATLSHGDQKLLDIALALVLEPKVLLLDEPTAGMGHEDIERIAALIKRVAADRTVLAVVTVDSYADAIAKANASEYGLSAAIVTRSASPGRNCAIRPRSAPIAPS